VTGSRPWTADHVTRLVVGNAAALALIGAGWWQLADLGIVRDQLAWFTVSVVGLGVAGVTNGVWLLRGQRAIGLARREMVATLTAPAPAAAAAANGTGSANGAHHGDGLVSAPATARYHRVGCALVSGRAVQSAGRGAHEQAGRRPCEACRP
jgi:hypothetical protein